MISIRIDERTIHGNLCRIIEHASAIIFVLVDEMGCGMYLCVTNKIYFGLVFSGVIKIIKGSLSNIGSCSLISATLIASRSYCIWRESN